jgi:hypothetical protein
VGDGSEINIWENHWIPSSFTQKVQTICGQCLLQSVNELIDLATNTWGEVLIIDNFFLIDAERIQKIPLNEYMQ